MVVEVSQLALAEVILVAKQAVGLVGFASSWFLSRNPALPVES